MIIQVDTKTLRRIVHDALWKNSRLITRLDMIMIDEAADIVAWLFEKVDENETDSEFITRLSRYGISVSTSDQGSKQ